MKEKSIVKEMSLQEMQETNGGAVFVMIGIGLTVMAVAGAIHIFENSKEE